MALTVNLALKYSGKVQQAFKQKSLLEGRSSNKVDFVGAKTVRITTVGTVPLVDYNRTLSGNRYGTPTEAPDFVQELTMSQDKSFSATIDKGNTKEQTIRKAGAFLRVQQDEVVTPYKDAYGFKVLAHGAGSIVGSTTAIAKANALERLRAARKAVRAKHADMARCTFFVSSDVYNAICESDPFTSVDKLAVKSIVHGQVGMLFGARVIEVPDDLMPDKVNFLLVHSESFTSPAKIDEMKTHIDAPGISGQLIEGRYLFDTFVIGAKAGGIYADVAEAPTAAPTITASSGSVTLAEGCKAKVTLDGSDPRYSMSAQLLSATGVPTGVAKGDVIRAYQFKADGSGFASPVAEATKS